MDESEDWVEEQDWSMPQLQSEEDVDDGFYGESMMFRRSAIADDDNIPDCNVRKDQVQLVKYEPLPDPSMQQLVDRCILFILTVAVVFVLVLSHDCIRGDCADWPESEAEKYFLGAEKSRNRMKESRVRWNKLWNRTPWVRRRPAAE
jgi:hypothetical protein